MRSKLATASLLFLLLFLTGMGYAQFETERSNSQMFQSDQDSLHQRLLPEWFDDAKLGIFVHWGLYSVPAWSGKGEDAPKESQVPHVEQASWYLNTLRVAGSPTFKYHQQKYGRNFDYYQFVPAFNQAVRQWKPEVWAKHFKEAGARYVVMTAKPPDGFSLWQSQVNNPNLKAKPERDLVGVLSKAFTEKGLKMGLYYSAGLDWTFSKFPMTTIGDEGQGLTQDEAYAAYVDAQYRELIQRYHPALLWNEIFYPKKGNFYAILSDYYQRNPKGVVNDRWKGAYSGDYTTLKDLSQLPAPGRKWELIRSLGTSSGYSQTEPDSLMMSVNELVDLLVEVVSKNGNLLLGIGPKADGTIPRGQLQRLKGLGEWLKINGEAIYGSRPWLRTGETSPEGVPLRYTRKGKSLYVLLLAPPESGITFTIPAMTVTDHTVIELLGSEDVVSWVRNGEQLMITLPLELPGHYAYALKITPEPKNYSK
jgi:alpha-L-fucosidase